MARRNTWAFLKWLKTVLGVGLVVLGIWTLRFEGASGVTFLLIATGVALFLARNKIYLGKRRPFDRTRRFVQGS